MIGVIDNRLCNIFSLTNMVKKLGYNFKIVKDAENFDGFEKLIIPGVGAFPKAMKNLHEAGLINKIKNFAASGRPLLGICLGMQLLFEESEEFEVTKGFGLIPGKIIKIRTDRVLPHMGWNSININNKSQILKGLNNGYDFYFVHSFRAECDNKYIAAYSEYSEKIPAVVFNKNVYGTQFHPEKSQTNGEILLKNFLEL